MRWARATLTLALLAPAACGGGDDTATAGDGSARLETTASTTASTAASAPSGETTASSVTVAASSRADGAAPSPTTTAPAEASLDANVPVGAFAPALLRADRSSRLVLEVHADAEPADATLRHVRDVLADVSAKPVAVVQAGAPGAGTRAWTAVELRDTADAGARSPQGGGVAVVRLLFVHGTFEGDDDVLGVAVRGDVAAVFVDRVAAAGGLLGGGTRAVEASVTTHELGHLLGLVDLYLATGRADPEHPGHSSNRRSVMHWAVESSLLGELLGADPPRDFDADDLADLAAIRAGA